MLTALVMGFAGGLPLFLTSTVLQAWMKESGVDLGTIGLFALVGLPYTLKFLWAPLMDRYIPSLLGRRRGWLLIWQLFLTAAIGLLAFSDPSQLLMMTAVAALLLSFFSASQDIVIDAYRRESLSDDEQGMGAALYVSGYRIGILLATGGGLIMADYMSYQSVYLVMATVMAGSIIATLLAKEPEMNHGHPSTLREAVINPFKEYFTRKHAILILLFIFLYKVGDTMASQMTIPFYLELGFSKTEIGSIVKLFGFWATIGGTFLGGLMIMRFGIFFGLIWFGLLQALSTAGFAALAVIGYNPVALGFVITFENLSAGLGTAAFIAFMASLTDKRFTATQYALLTSFMGMPRVFAAAPTGFMAESMGWFSFFIFCTLIALPGLLLLYWLDKRLQTES
ncbi:MAG: AmpG family muropeptide MFS transporter [Gammaproteobacteria bacterium]|nr:AmpG family muropeptide MFS transporter [Gammaproteobacteria bacterium]MCK5262507.1 AmpG family muropeptide MFS transporter [Gammaproteobacteria bacterium]